MTDARAKDHWPAAGPALLWAMRGYDEATADLLDLLITAIDKMPDRVPLDYLRAVLAGSRLLLVPNVESLLPTAGDTP